jgi:hypothetical protein
MPHYPSRHSKDPFETTSLHEIQLNFKSCLSNTPSSAAQLQKNGEVSPNFMIFTKQQKKCFTNRIFKPTHKIRHKLPVITTVYMKNGSICFLLASSLSRSTDQCRTALHGWPRAMPLPHPSPRNPATAHAAVPRTPSWPWGP